MTLQKAPFYVSNFIFSLLEEYPRPAPYVGVSGSTTLKTHPMHPLCFKPSISPPLLITEMFQWFTKYPNI